MNWRQALAALPAGLIRRKPLVPSRAEDLIERQSMVETPRGSCCGFAKVLAQQHTDPGMARRTKMARILEKRQFITVQAAVPSLRMRQQVEQPGRRMALIIRTHITAYEYCVCHTNLPNAPLTSGFSGPWRAGTRITTENFKPSRRRR